MYFLCHIGSQADHEDDPNSQCLKITQNVAFEFLPSLAFLMHFCPLTSNVNIARFARIVACDFFCDFQTLWDSSLSTQKPPSRQPCVKTLVLNRTDCATSVLLCLSNMMQAEAKAPKNPHVN